jgi:hypothetical protein
MQTSKVTNIQGAGTWEHPQGGTLFQFDVELEDGTAGRVNAKSERPWYGVGSEVAYRITKEHPTYGKSLKFDKPEYAQAGQSFGGGRQGNPNREARIQSSWAIGQAIQVMQGGRGILSDPSQGGSNTDTIKATARVLIQMQTELEAEILAK